MSAPPERAIVPSTETGESSAARTAAAEAGGERLHLADLVDHDEPDVRPGPSAGTATASSAAMRTR